MSRAGSPESSSRAGYEAGFTLIELMVALLVVGLLSAVAYARIDGLSRPGIDRVAGSVVAELRRARHDAMRSGRPAEVDLDRLAAILPQGMRLETDGSEPIILLPTGGTSGAELSLRGNGEERHIEIDWLTGRVTRKGRQDEP